MIYIKGGRIWGGRGSNSSNNKLDTNINKTLKVLTSLMYSNYYEGKKVKLEEMKEIWKKEITKINNLDLEGTEKQIKWAKDIKQRKLSDMFSNAIQDYNILLNTDKNKIKHKRYKDKIKDKTKSIKQFIEIKSAKNLIEGRYNDVY